MLKKRFKSTNNLIVLLDQLNIRKGDNVILHSNLGGLYQFEEKLSPEHFLKFILNYLGEKGTLLIPTYNYNFTKGEPFSRRKSKSQVGLLGNSLIKKYYKSRTIAPVFSHIVFGRLKKLIFKCDIENVFGDQSIFSILKKKNFKILCFCCSPKNITFLHFIEQQLKVNYRYNKLFHGISEKKKITIKYFVGKKHIDYSPKEKKILKLVNNKQFRETEYGRFKSYSVEANYLFKELRKKIKKRNNYIIGK